MLEMLERGEKTLKLGDVIDDPAFERRLLRLAREYERRIGLLVDRDGWEQRTEGKWSSIPKLLEVMRQQNRPMTYREVMEYLPIPYTNKTRWATRSRFTYLTKCGLMHIHDEIEAYNNIWSPRFVLEDVAKGEVAERAAKLKTWFDNEVDKLEAMRMRRSCIAATALDGSMGIGVGNEAERNKQIVLLRRRGLRYSQIAELYGVSHQRIGQIIQRAIKTSLTQRPA